VEDISFFTSPPHVGQDVAGGSENFWRSSKAALQAEHWYSYTGIGKKPPDYI
jgi:hypothetical protein